MSISNLFQDNVYKIFSSEIDTSSYKYKGNAFYKTTDTVNVVYTYEGNIVSDIDIVCSLVGKTVTVYMSQKVFEQGVTGPNPGPSFTIQLPAGYHPSAAQNGTFYSTFSAGTAAEVGHYTVDTAGLITFVPRLLGGNTTAGANETRTTPNQCITFLLSP